VRVPRSGPFCGEELIESITDGQEEFHRQWIELFIDRDQGPSASEWALAWFALDNNLHQACHLGADVAVLRLTHPNSPEMKAQIEQSVNDLVSIHRKWRQRKIVLEAEEMEKKGKLLGILGSAKPDSTPLTFTVDISAILPSNRLPSLSDSTSPPLCFLHYPPVTLTNRFYANLLNHYRSIEIYLTLIARPLLGSLDPWRFQCAIDLCRTHAALGEERNFLTTGKIWGLWLSGVTFGGPELYPVYRPLPHHAVTLSLAFCRLGGDNW
jgi:hypothetical protein